MATTTSQGVDISEVLEREGHIPSPASVSPPPELRRAASDVSAYSANPEPPRHRFSVELKEGVTTVVSMKELLRMEAPTIPPLAAAEPEHAPKPVKPVTHEEQQLPPISEGPGLSDLIDRIDRIDKLYGANCERQDSQGLKKVGSEPDIQSGVVDVDDTELNVCFTKGEKMTRRYSGFYIHTGPFEPLLSEKSKANGRKRKTVTEASLAHEGSLQKTRKPRCSQPPSGTAATKRRKEDVEEQSDCEPLSAQKTQTNGRKRKARAEACLAEAEEDSLQKQRKPRASQAAARKGRKETECS